jgi:hypothetical protein
MNAQFSWLDMFRVADVCVAHWADLVKRKHMIGAAMAAFGIRTCWRMSDAESRSMIAARVAVWRYLGKERVAKISQSVLRRERERLIQVRTGGAQ